MSSADKESEVIYKDFKSALEELYINSKPHINMLTMLAEECHAHAPAVVKAIEERLVQAPPDVKIPILYVMDSIIKNLKESDYLALFDKNVVTLFVQTFEQLDERNRQALHKLRMTWVDVFCNRKLYAIDVAINKLDNGWPIVALPEMSIHVNPNFMQLADNKGKLTGPSVGKAVNVNRDPRLTKASPREADTIVSLRNKAISLLSNETVDTKKRKRVDRGSSSSSDESDVNRTKAKANSPINDTHIFCGGDKDYRNHGPLPRPWAESSPVAECVPAIVHAPVLPQTGVALVPTSQANVPPVPSQACPRLSIFPTSSWLSPVDPLQLPSPQSSWANSICTVEVDGRTYNMKPNEKRIFQLYGIRYEFLCDTTVKAVFVNSKAIAKFGEPRRCIDLPGARSRRVWVQYVGQLIDIWVDGHPFELRADGPSQPVVVNGRQYSFRLDSRTRELTVDNVVRAVDVGEVPLQIHLDEQDRQFNRLHEVRFSPPPKLIFIDGVQYLMRYDLAIPCAQTADGQFYAIRFNGPPREIFIDSIPHVVPFDRPGRVKFDRRAHEIAWGGPGFEVIVDGKPHEIQFNQPGRNVMFGLRLHHVRIQGPPPEVKLMERLPFNNLDQGMPQPGLAVTNPFGHGQLVKLFPGHQAQAQQRNNPVQDYQWPQLDVKQLYDNLLKHGIINKPVEAEPTATQRYEAGDNEESNQGQCVKDLSIDELKRFNRSITESLYRGTQCPQCGLRFSEHLKNQYQTHLDWHFRWNRREKDVALGGQTLHRDWYYSLDVWLKIEEIRDENDIVVPEDEEDVAPAACKVSEFSCPAAQDDRENVCRVCCEPFDQFYHEEREEWHLRNAVRVGDWVYHAVCLQDAEGADIDTSFDSAVAETLEDILKFVVSKDL